MPTNFFLAKAIRIHRRYGEKWSKFTQSKMDQITTKNIIPNSGNLRKKNKKVSNRR